MGSQKIQKKDGTLTSAGKKRYSQSQNGKNAKKYDKYYTYYKSQGLSDQDAEQKAKGRIKTDKVLMAVGAATVAAAAVYVGYRYYDKTADRFISPDKVMQTVHKGDINERLKPGSPFFATYTKADNTIYASKVFSHFDKDSTVSRFYTEDGIKVASEKTGEKILKELYKSNPEIAKYATELEKAGVKRGRSMYERFNYSLVLRNDSSSTSRMGVGALDHDKAHKIFYDELRKRGYGAVMDINDKKIEGFTFNPVIVFDNQKKHIVGSVKATSEHLGTSRTLKGAAYSTARKKLLRPVNPLNPYTVAGGYYVAALGLTRADETRRINAANNFLTTYKQQHPRTSLSDTEILKMYTKQ